MNINVRISIIVAVYNAEHSIRILLNSIKAQTMDDFEVIMVDDGSVDSSGAICDEYAKQDFRFRIIHKQNGGVSAARQTGIDNAVGEYIIHADADDWVEPTMLEELYDKAKNDDADIVICDYYNENIRGEVSLRKQQPSDLDHLSVLNDLFKDLHGSCWNKLVRRICYTKYNIRFPEGINHCEDFLTWVELLQKNVRVSYLNRAFYHYCENENSITRKYDRKTYEIRRKFLQRLTEIMPLDLSELVFQSEFNVFIEAVVYNVLNEQETREGLVKYKSKIRELGLRWRTGFFFLKIGQNKIAHVLLRY